MKIRLQTLLPAAMAIYALAITGQAAYADSWESRGVDVPAREHRAIWMSPYLSNNWPSSPITTTNAASLQRTLQNRLDKFKEHNVNVLYYHVRSMCDANYNSAYEPWSAQVGGKRGTAPAFDPFEFIIETAHERGMEVYAWVNPYRYSSSTSTNPYGEGELNYENSHPEWLLRNANQTVLNPGIEGVKQRIVDVIKDIITKYDVDGVIFDDYFYGQGGTDMSADAAQYNQYTSNGGQLSQADWRRANVNEMVQRVHAAIKETKPHVCFGISPAGVSSPTNIESEYGLKPYSGDWQYNQIYSDPLAWLKAGTVDFVSPQIYWPGQFDALSAWWQTAARKFARHCYPSVTLSSISSVRTPEFLREVEETRLNSNINEAGIVYFEYSQYVNYYENIFGKSVSFGDNVGQGVYPTKAMTPLRVWDNSYKPVSMSGVKIQDGNLVWDAIKDMRYTVYAFPKNLNATFSPAPQYLREIRYTNSMTLPADYNDYLWFVAPYDRFGNEYCALQSGATVTTSAKPSLVYPENGQAPVDLFDFEWSAGNNAGSAQVQLATDAAFTNIVGNAYASGNQLSVTAFNGTLEVGKTYYWRVYANPVNGTSALSDVRSFVAPRIALTAPSAQQTEVSLTPTISWSKAVDGASYLVELSRAENFSPVVYSATTDKTSVTIPEKTLISGRPYYARVTASKGNASSTSEVITFSTVNRTDYTAPAFLVPAKDGATVHANEIIKIAAWEGMNAVKVNIATSSTFPARSSFAYSYTGFDVDMDKTAGEIKVSSKNLVDGTTYYIRAVGQYYLTGSTAVQETAPNVMTFVYSSTNGVNTVEADSEAIYLNGNTLVAPAGTPVAVYTLQGVKILETVCSGTVDLNKLPRGAYIINTPSNTLKFLR